MNTAVPTASVEAALAHAMRLLAQDPKLAAEQARQILLAVPGEPGARLVLGGESAGGNLAAALAKVQAKFFVASFSSDWRFSPERSREIVQALYTAGAHVSYAEIESHHGHDSFLLPIPQYLRVMRSYLERMAEELGV